MPTNKNKIEFSLFFKNNENFLLCGFTNNSFCGIIKSRNNQTKLNYIKKRMVLIMQQNFRVGLQKFVNKEETFFGTFSRYGERKKNGKLIQTILLKNVRVREGELVTDHMWIDTPQELLKEKLQHGTKIKMKGTAVSYLKGYLGNTRKIGKMTKSGNLGLDYEIVPRIVYVVRKEGN